MKKYSLIILGLLLLLTGCGSKSFFSLDIGNFVCKFYHNGVVYKETQGVTDIEGLEVFKQFTEDVDPEYTGYIKSLFVIKVPLDSGLDIQEIVDVNKKQLQSKLLQYTQLEDKTDKVKCKEEDYPGYITTFSYLLGEELIYDGQYYLIDTTTLYMFSLSSDSEKDIKHFIKSVNKIRCNK